MPLVQVIANQERVRNDYDFICHLKWELLLAQSIFFEFVLIKLLYIFSFLSAIFCSYEQVSSGSALYPNVEGYDIPTPLVPLKYGFPDHKPKSLGNTQKLYDSELPPPKNDRPVVFSNQAAVDIIDASALSSENSAARTIPVSRQKRSLIDYPQPTTTTRSRTRYDDEGKWKIIRQEEKKEQQKYDYL